MIKPGDGIGPVVIAHPASGLNSLGGSRSFSVIAAGRTPLTYQWQFNSNNISGATVDTLFLTNLGLADFGAYRVVVGNSLGSVTSSNALLQLDSDRDGMADSWEITYFGSITNRSGFEDYDQDGVSDLDEFLEGTGPKNFSSVNPRLTIVSDRGEVFVTPNVPFFTNGQTLTLTGVPDPGQQFLSYIGWGSSGPAYTMRTNPAQLRLGAIGVSGSQMVRAIFGLPIPDSLDVTNGWRIDQAGWFGQTNVTHDGVDAVQSARSFDNEQAVLELTNRMSGEGTITFWWKVDGTPRDELRFVVNNKPRPGAIGTNTDWQLRTYYLPAGTNIIRWIYDKGGNEVSEYNGLFYAPADAGWVDEVTYEVYADPGRDSDRNGLADLWEYKYFDTRGVDPNGDPDRDGISNLDEFLEHTDPTSNASLLPRLTVITSGGTVVRNPDLPKYNYSQTVQLQAVPDPDNYFVIWGGAVSGTNTTNSVLMNRNQTITAIFGLPLPVALETPSLTWTRSGQLGWFGQTTVSHDGVDAAQSGPVDFRQESWMETIVTGPGTLTFWWKSSSATNRNFARFLIDGAEQPGKISGEVDWQPQVHYLADGSHTLRWAYTNNTATVSLTNGAWVDQVQFTAGTTAPEILSQPTDLVVLQGSNAVFKVAAAGTPPTSYQWYFNGTSLGAVGTGAILTLTNVSLAQAGSYYANISNAGGDTNTTLVTLTVLPVPPVNDNFANRIPLSDTNEITGHNFGATTEASEPDHGGTFADGSVWWKWTAAAAGKVRLTARSRGSSGALVAAVYSGTTLANLAPVASKSQNPAYTNGQYVATLELPFIAVAGVDYAIALAHQFDPGGFLTLQLVPLAAPLNDAFANRISLLGASATDAGSNENATYEAGEPLSGFGTGSLWWSWTAPRTGEAVATATGADFAPLLGVYTGSTMSGLASVALGFPLSTNNETRVEFEATAGTPYQFSVDSFAASGLIRLNVAMAAPSFLFTGLGAGGSFGFSVSAPAGARYEIQGSNDLVNWTTLEAGIVPSNGIISFTDANASRQASRFYRVLLLP